MAQKLNKKLVFVVGSLLLLLLLGGLLTLALRFRYDAERHVRAGDQARVVWQVPHSEVVGMWFGPLVTAFVPSWQLEHVPLTWAWSTLVAGFHVAVLWQASHAFEVVMCVAPWPGAAVPLWQEKHVPVTWV